MPKRKAPKEDDGFPTGQLLALGFCRIAEPIAFTSILSYNYVMIVHFQHGDDTNASFYAGLLVSAFAVAEASTAMVWGTISDRYGRKPIVLIGLAGTALSSLLFGFATNFWVALGARVVGGLLNGNVAVMQTMVAEMCTKPEYEPRAYAMPPFMWSLGSIVGAAMGGYLAEPARFYPSIFSKDGLFGVYPYLLPNLVAVGAIVLAIIQGYFFLKETNPRFHAAVEEDDEEDDGPADERTPLQPKPRRNSVLEVISTGTRRPSFISGSMPTMIEPSFDLRKGSITTLHDVQTIKPKIVDTEPIQPIKAFNRQVILWTIALVVMCYHQMAFGSLLPIYFLDEPNTGSSLDLKGGLGYTVHDVGAYMSVNGVIALFIQAAIFPVFVGRVGVWKSLVSLLILCPITYVIVPFLSLLPRANVQWGVYGVLALENFFMIIIYPCLLIAIKNATSSPLVLGKVNGLAMSACSGARTIAPPLTGIIYSAGGSAIAWWSIAGVAVVGIIELCFISRPDGDADVTVKPVFARKAAAEPALDSLEEHTEH